MAAWIKAETQSWERDAKKTVNKSTLSIRVKFMERDRRGHAADVRGRVTMQTAARTAASKPTRKSESQSKWIPTACDMCYVGSGGLVEVDKGIAVNTEGDPASPQNRGNIWAKGKTGRALPAMFRPLGLIVATAAMLASCPAIAQPQDEAAGYPNRIIRIIVSAPPAGGPDIVSRLLAEKLQQKWGQPVIVENRAGAGGNLGAAVV